jgi:hypothetical protein
VLAIIYPLKMTITAAHGHMHVLAIPIAIGHRGAQHKPCRPVLLSNRSTLRRLDHSNTIETARCRVISRADASVSHLNLHDYAKIYCAYALTIL